MLLPPVQDDHDQALRAIAYGKLNPDQPNAVDTE
jgi:hypothetical protein